MECRFAQWVSTLAVFGVQLWFLMRNPFLGTPGGREYVAVATSEIGFLCSALLPSSDAVCGTAPPLIEVIDRSYHVVATCIQV
jgi:hypothetical protein